MDVVARDDVIENAQSMAAASLAQPKHPSFPVMSESEQELAFVATMRQVPDVTSDVMAVGAGHGLSRMQHRR
jgi:hypothetical protein